MKRSVLTLLSILASAYVLICVLALVFQPKLVYFPGPPPSWTPDQEGFEYRDLTLRTSDGVDLHAWYFPADEPRGAVIVSHGNAGTIANRVPHAQAFLAAGFSVLLYDYRGYGRSAGRPSEAGTYRDAEAAYDWLTADAGVAPAQVVSYGESLGGGVALELAHRRSVGAVVLESAFTSLPDVGRRFYPWLPVKLLSRIVYDNRSKIAELRVPVLVIHSPGDEIVAYDFGRELFRLAHEPKTFLVTEAGHNDGGFLRRPEWREAVGEFLADAVRE